MEAVKEHIKRGDLNEGGSSILHSMAWAGSSDKDILAVVAFVLKKSNRYKYLTAEEAGANFLDFLAATKRLSLVTKILKKVRKARDSGKLHDQLANHTYMGGSYEDTQKLCDAEFTENEDQKIFFINDESQEEEWDLQTYYAKTGTKFRRLSHCPDLQWFKLHRLFREFH